MWVYDFRIRVRRRKMVERVFLDPTYRFRKSKIEHLGMRIEMIRPLAPTTRTSVDAKCMTEVELLDLQGCRSVKDHMGVVHHSRGKAGCMPGGVVFDI